MWPPAAVVEALVPLLDDLAGRVVRPEKLHVTLRFFGSEPVDVDRLRSHDLAPAVAQLGPSTATFGRSVLHVPVAGLSALAAVVDPAPHRPFTGHLTVARARSRGDDLRRVAGGSVPAAARVPWPVDEVTLVGSEGGRYAVLERVPLG